MNKDKTDIHQVVTDKIVAAMEAGAGSWRMPWAQSGAAVRPVNVATGNRYNGINVLALWAAAVDLGYDRQVWGTYKQWEAKGAQVRKGEKSTMIVFFKPLSIKDENGEDKSIPMARATPVFNAAQVDGWTQPTPKAPPEPAELIEAVERYVAGTGAVVRIGGDRALYSPALDEIRMPPIEAFHGSKVASPTEAHASVKLHELVHWSGAATRLKRDFSGRFGTASYAMEELVAELGAAFLCADLRVSVEPRADHAQYLASWLGVLKNDKTAIFKAASAASTAHAYLDGLQAPVEAALLCA